MIRYIAILAACFSGLYLVGLLSLWLNPPSDIDRRCLAKPAAEVRSCIAHFNAEAKK